jgi:hypothetical protein
MNTFLLASPASGFFWLFILFSLCFVGVHVARLARIGKEHLAAQKRSSKNPPASNEPKKETSKPRDEKSPTTPPTSSTPAPEPVYYIVERKRRRTRESYSEPKEIKFK